MSSPPPPRIVITGIGLVTPGGANRESSWRAISAGRSATRWLNGEWSAALHSSPWPAAFGKPAGAPLPSVPFDESESESDPVVACALRAAEEAVRDAGLAISPANRDRTGCVIGTSKGGLRTFASALQRRESDGHDSVPGDDWWHQFVPNAPALWIARRFDARGAALCPVAACATGLVSIARGAELIRDGICDAVLAGSSDASLQPAILGSFHRMGVLARGFDDPASACRPFDAHRNGFLIGEGAAVLVLEREDLARERGARAYAEWLASATAADPAGLTRMEPDARSLARVITDVLRRSGVSPDEIDYVNLHATATRQNDLCETRAVKRALGAASRRVACSGLKGGLGHLLGAAGSVEVAATLLALRDGLVPPTVNLRTVDSACDLDLTPISPRPRRIETALKLSLGFGGHLAAAVVRGCPDRSPRAV